MKGSCRFIFIITAKKRKREKSDSLTAVIFLKQLEDLLSLTPAVCLQPQLCRAAWNNKIITTELLLLGRKKPNDVQ